MFDSDEETSANSGETAADDIHDAAAAPAADAPAHPMHVLVEEWFAKHFHGLGPHLTEVMHAKLHAAKEELKTLLSTLS